MQACVFSGQTRFIQGMQAKFRCTIFANLLPQGEVIRVDTVRGEYIERANK